MCLYCFPLIGNWLSWIIKEGKNVNLGIDPYMRCVGHHQLPHKCLNTMSEQGMCRLANVSYPNDTNI